jgi:hypothetical protein
VSSVTSLPSHKHRNSRFGFEAHGSLTFACRASGCSAALAETCSTYWDAPLLWSFNCDIVNCLTSRPSKLPACRASRPTHKYHANCNDVVSTINCYYQNIRVFATIVPLIRSRARSTPMTSRRFETSQSPTWHAGVPCRLLL